MGGKRKSAISEYVGRVVCVCVCDLTKAAKNIKNRFQICQYIIPYALFILYINLYYKYYQYFYF